MKEKRKNNNNSNKKKQNKQRRKMASGCQEKLENNFKPINI